VERVELLPAQNARKAACDISVPRKPLDVQRVDAFAHVAHQIVGANSSALSQVNFNLNQTSLSTTAHIAQNNPSCCGCSRDYAHPWLNNVLPTFLVHSTSD